MIARLTGRWRAFQQCRQWRRELRDVPLKQLRAMVDRSVFHQTPGKDRCIERWIELRENVWKVAAWTAGFLVALLGLLIALIR
jgi:hypothetical protein